MAASRKWLFKKKPSGQGLWLARVKTCDQPTQGSSLRDQVGGEIRPSRRGRRVGVANGAYLACLPGHRHLVWCLGNGGCPDLERANSDPGRRAGRSCDQKQVARTFVRGVQNDGVEYLRPAEERWGEIAHYPDLINKYADRLIEIVRRAWSDHQSFQYVTGTSICLSCLLEAGRYDELQELLATRRQSSGPGTGSEQRRWSAKVCGKALSHLLKACATPRIPVSRTIP